MNDPQPVISITPVRGTRPFRRNARLTLAAGVLTVTDRHGQSSSVALDGSPSAPCFVSARADQTAMRNELAILDREGRAFAILNVGDWDSFEFGELEDVARLQPRYRNPEDTPPRRPDTRVIVDSDWWRFAPTVGPAGFAAGMLSMAGSSFRWIGAAVLLAAFTYVMTAFAIGAFSKPRRGLDRDALEAWKRGDNRLLEAHHELRRKRREKLDAAAADGTISDRPDVDG